VRIDEFSNMGAGVAGLSDQERMRFACFGFDLTPGAVTIVGIVKAAVTMRKANISVTMTV
jgi:hypothetical protein